MVLVFTSKFAGYAGRMQFCLMLVFTSSFAGGLNLGTVLNRLCRFLCFGNLQVGLLFVWYRFVGFGSRLVAVGLLFMRSVSMVCEAVLASGLLFVTVCGSCLFWFSPPLYCFSCSIYSYPLSLPNLQTFYFTLFLSP